MSRAKTKSEFFRVCVSVLLASLGTVAILAILVWVTEIDFARFSQLPALIYAVFWPQYTAIYVGWSARVYSRLDPASLRWATAEDDRVERRIVPRLLGLTGETNTTISAAILAVIVTISIAQQPEFRSEGVFVGLALLTVASSWVLLVFSFAQSYMRLGSGEEPGAHFRFQFPETPRFGDYVTLAVLLSTMAATVSADVTSRRAWRVIRANVAIAFVFNSVIIAMMVSLLFGGLLS